MRGVADSKKRRSIFDKHRQNADFFILQETHSTKEVEKVWENEWGGKAIFSHGTSASRGIAIFMSKETHSKISNIHVDDQGRLIICDLKEQDFLVTIIAIYAPNEDSPMFYRNIATRIKERQEHKILIGDFNLVLDVSLDRENTYNNNNKAKEEVENLCDQYYLKDIWRIQNGNKREFSWMKKGSYPIKASRIDLALVTGGLDQVVKTVQYLSSIFTDHRGVYMVIDFTTFDRGVGYWKFNNSFLQNLDFVQFMNHELELTIQSIVDKNPIQAWETIKKRIKERTLAFSRSKVREDKIIIAELSEIINDYESRLPLDEQETELLYKTKADLEEKSLERIQGVMFRSKAKWYAEGEKSSKYFFALEKARYNAKTCYVIIDEEGNEIKNPHQILEEQKSFYTKLYAKDENVQFSLQNTFDITVPEQIRENQQQQITIQNLQESMARMSNNKTPGEDGIPVDFYKVFWNKIKQPFYDMMLQVYENKELHDSARTGILNLIPKAGKDMRYIKNLRPITLLNTDYKLIEKAIADKMIPALEHLIHTDQRGFMKNRRISVNIRKMLDIIHMAEKQDLEAVVLSLDFVKCFDKCSFSILHGSLNYFKFGAIVREWTEILYHKFSVKVQNNGYFSTEIPIMKGVHQGGCCSSIYFLVIAEILALSLRANEEIEGITFQDIKHLLNQFADDMDIFSLCKEKSIRAIYEELDKFKLQSGFTVSYEKTTMYRIGSLRHSDAAMYNMTEFVWSNQDITVLGVTITHDDLVSKNYDTIITKMKNFLYAWHNRDLSLIGKVQVVNTLIASLFVYKMMVLPMIPRNIIKNIENTIREFLWNGGKSKIAYNILQNPKKQGGLNLVNMVNKEKALKATWPKILADEEDYADLVYQIMRCSTIKEEIWRCSIHPQDVKFLKIKSNFWSDVLQSWCEYNYHTNCRIDNQILWYNSKIKIGGKPFYWKQTKEKGLMYVYQIFEEGQFLSEEEMKREYDISTLRYNSLKAALPKEWILYFQDYRRQQYFPLAPHNYDMYITNHKKLSQQIYKFLSEDITVLHNKYHQWRAEIGDFCMSLYDFRYITMEIYSITNITKFRSFQYRLLNRGLVTNIQLEKWSLASSNLCSFCLETRETMIHLLYECQVTQELWKKVEQYVKEIFPQLPTQWDLATVVLNRVCNVRNHAINFICLVTKQYVYSQKCLGNKLIFQELKARIRNVQNLEKYIVVQAGKLDRHNKKWSGFETPS